MIKWMLRVLYGLLVVAGLIAIGWMYYSNPTKCLTGDKICFTYSRDWTVAKTAKPYDFHLTRTKPQAAQFEMALTTVNISGSANALAGALKQQLGKDAPGFRLIESNAIVISKTLAVEMVFDYTPQGAPGAVRQMYVVMPIDKHTYYFVAEATAANYDKVKPAFDKLLGSVELK